MTDMLDGKKADSSLRVLLAGSWAIVFAIVFYTLIQLLVSSEVFHGLDRRIEDWAWRLGAQATPERRVVVVDIDEASLVELGPWPWPRARLAELAKRIDELGASQQIYDLVLADERPGDDALRSALIGGNGVISQVFALDQGEAVTSGHLMGDVPGMACQAPLPQGRGYVASAAGFSGGTSIRAGHITPRIDNDGAVRRIPSLICFNGRAYPALALAGFWNGLSNAPGQAQPRLRPGTGWLDPDWWLDHPSAPYAVPLSSQADIAVPYGLSPESIVSISARDILKGDLSKGALAGTWVVVGATAFGLADAVPTPYGGAVGGVSIHARLLAGFLDGVVPYSPRQAWVLQVILTLALTLPLVIFALKSTRIPVYGLPVLGVLASGGCMVFSMFALLHWRWQIGWSQPAVFMLLVGITLASTELLRTRIEKDRLYQHLASYLPAPVASALLWREVETQPVAERREVTVLIADIRNFSMYCENYPPEAAAKVLHNFLKTAVSIVEAEGGVVEAVHGDSVLAVWNGSKPCANPASHAAAAAKSMLPAIEATFPVDDDSRFPPLALGIGVESGSALIGSFGPVNRRVHTALGEVVTVASAIQNMTSDLGIPILFGPAVSAELSSNELESQGVFLLEGLTRTHVLYALTPANAAQVISKESFVLDPVSVEA